MDISISSGVYLIEIESRFEHVHDINYGQISMKIKHFNNDYAEKDEKKQQKYKQFYAMN